MSGKNSELRDLEGRVGLGDRGDGLLGLRVALKRPLGGFVRRVDRRCGGHRVIEQEEGAGGQADQVVELLGDLACLSMHLVQRLARFDHRYADVRRRIGLGELLGIAHLQVECGLDPLGAVEAVKRLRDFGEEVPASPCRAGRVRSVRRPWRA